MIVADGVIGSDAERGRADRRPWPGARARAGRSAHAPAGAGLRAQGDGRDGHAGRRGGRLHGRRVRWPTPNPPADNAAIVQAVRDLAAAAGLVRRVPGGGDHARARGARRSPRWARWSRPASGSSATTGARVPTARLLRNALTYAKAFPVDVVLAEHAEDASLVEGGQMHEGVRSSALGLAGRPAEAEEIIVARDLAVARACGGRLHLCHLSTARAVELVRRAKAEGVRVTAEVTPHHLVFTDDDLVTYDTTEEDEPAAAHGRGPRRAPGGARRRHDRRDRDRSRAARRRGEGDGVRPRATGHDRARDRARGRAHLSRRARACSR